MIRITDRTLSCLDGFNAPPEKLRRFTELLVESGADFIELSVPVYNALSELPEKGKYILRVKDADEALNYLGFSRYVCRKCGRPQGVSVISEIQANDIREINMLSQFSNLENVRIVGFDDIMTHNYQSAFNQLKQKIHGRIELCPENRGHCATAIAVEWIISGGTDVVTSFMGVGGFAPYEEVVMALRMELRHKPTKSYSIFPEMLSIIEEITGVKASSKKPVLGKDIFTVEAGIHVSGIMKQPKTYEPFPPELVGNTRSIVLGKHSGKKALEVKLKSLGIDVASVNLSELLVRVRKFSIENKCGLSDDDFKQIADDYLASKSEKTS